MQKKKIIAVIREALLVISEESQGTRKTPFFLKKQHKKINSENDQLVSLVAISYEILKGII